MGSTVSLVVFEGGQIHTELEAQMAKVRQGMVLDLIDRACWAGFRRILVVTSYEELATTLSSGPACGSEQLSVEVVLTPKTEKPFHFGQQLWDLVQRYGLEKILYLGGASAPLISSGELKYIRELLTTKSQVVTANNYFSADLVGFCPAATLGQVSLPAIDNSLAWVLCNEGGLSYEPLERSLGLNFDIDTPVDILILSIHPNIGSYTKKAVQELDWDFHCHRQIKQLLNDPRAELAIFGRINPRVFEYLDFHCSCRLRLFSEERGMKALGRDEQGEVCSLVGRLVQELGVSEFFEFLAQICDGAVLDTRVLFEHFQWKLSAGERFASDLGKVSLISHPQLAAFTKAALEARIPILLGGHSLVTGGLSALVSMGYKETAAVK